MTDLTTITIAILERQKFERENPPASVEDPGFGARAGKTFSDSVEALRISAVETGIFLIMIAPWLTVMLVVALPLWLVHVRRQKRNRLIVATHDPEPN